MKPDTKQSEDSEVTLHQTTVETDSNQIDTSVFLSDAEVLCATLESVKPLNSLSLLMSGICLFLLVIVTDVGVLTLAGCGLIAGLIQNYYNWRVELDSRLIPLLIQQGPKQFDNALRLIFPVRIQHLVQHSIPQRLDGARTLFRRQYGWLVAQVFISIGAIVVHIAHSLI